MKALPTDWLYRDERFLIDLNYNVWDMDKEKIIYHERFTGEYSVKDILDHQVHWNNNPEDYEYTILDFLSDFQ